MKPGVTISPLDVHDLGRVDAGRRRVADEADAIARHRDVLPDGRPSRAVVDEAADQQEVADGCWARRPSIAAVHDTATATAHKSARYRRHM